MMNNRQGMLDEVLESELLGAVLSFNADAHRPLDGARAGNLKENHRVDRHQG